MCGCFFFWGSYIGIADSNFFLVLFVLGLFLVKNIFLVSDFVVSPV